jgi:hypothetical protein
MIIAAAELMIATKKPKIISRKGAKGAKCFALPDGSKSPGLPA